MIRLFVGHDERETVAYHVYAHSVQEKASMPVLIAPVMLEQIAWCFDRARHPLQSTAFAFSRFLVPFLCDYKGWALFADSDFLCRADISELWRCRDERFAIQVCQHDYSPSGATKFLDQPQTAYPRKNWSSLILFNNERCRYLTPERVEMLSGLDLHRFTWLKDREIGSLPITWNHLVGEYRYNENAKQVHFTLGGPYFDEYRDCDYADEWRACKQRMEHVTQTTDLRRASEPAAA